MNKRSWLGQVPLVVRSWGEGPKIPSPRLGQIQACCVESNADGSQTQKCFSTYQGQPCVLTWISPGGTYPGVPPCVNGMPAECSSPSAPSGGGGGGGVSPFTVSPPVGATGGGGGGGSLPAWTKYSKSQQPPPSGGGGGRGGGDGGGGGGGGVIPEDIDLFEPGPPPDEAAPTTALLPTPSTPFGLPSTAPAPSGPFPVQNLTVPAVPTGAFPGAPFTAVAPRPVPRPTQQAPRAPQPIPCPTGPIPVEQWTKGCVSNALARRP